MVSFENLIEIRINKFNEYTKKLTNFVWKSSLNLSDLYQYCLSRMEDWYHADDGINVVCSFENFLDDHKFFKKAWMNDKNAKEALLMAIGETYNAYKTYYSVFGKENF